MELVITDNLEHVYVTEDENFAKVIYQSAGKYIEEKYNVKVEINDYKTETGTTRIEFNVILKAGIHDIGEAIKFLLNYFQKREEIKEALEKIIVFYKNMLENMENSKKEETVNSEN